MLCVGGLNPEDEFGETHVFACRLRDQEALQDAITDDMVEMAAALKQGAMAISRGLATREATLDNASSKLAKSAIGAKAAVTGTKAALKRSSRSFWFTLFVMFAVGIAFLGGPLPLFDSFNCRDFYFERWLVVSATGTCAGLPHCVVHWFNWFEQDKLFSSVSNR